MRNLKKVIASLIAVAVLAALGTASVFAATQSVKKGDYVNGKTGKYTATSKTTASWVMTSKQKKSAKTVTIAKTATIKGQKLKVTLIGSKAIKGAKKLKTIKINANVKISKSAFKGYKKSKLAKIKVRIKKGSVSKKYFKSIKKSLIKKGFKAKNIKWY